MTKYREIIRLAGLNLSQTNIALSCNASKTTVNKVLKAAREQNLVWPLDPKLSDPVLGMLVWLIFNPASRMISRYLVIMVTSLVMQPLQSGCPILSMSAKSFFGTE